MGCPITRRQVVVGAGGAGVGSAGGALLAACARLPFQAQPPRLYQIGLLSPKPTYAGEMQAFRDGLYDLGYVEGQRIAIHYREYGLTTAGAPLADLAAELARLRVDVVVADGVPAIQAAQAASTAVPVVRLSTDLGSRRLALLLETSPGRSRVAVLWNPGNLASAAIWREAQAAAPALGARLQSLEIQAPDDLERAFEAASREHAEALLVAGDPPPSRAINVSARQIVGFANASRLPTIGPAFFAEQGALLGHGPDDLDLFRRAAGAVDQTLRGAQPADLSSEQSTKFELVVNLRTAQALGLTIPESLLHQATGVIR
jgi:putative ABC transport system substrate-binding protein